MGALDKNRVGKKEKHGYAVMEVIGNQICVTSNFYLIAC